VREAVADRDASESTEFPVAASRFAIAATLLPFVVSALVLILAVRGAYLPISDHALTEMHVRDIGHHQVLVGLYSRDDWSHPGPLLFYVLAPFYWLTGRASIALSLGALAINGGSIAAMALIARRRGGMPLMICTLLACSLLVRTLGPNFVRDPWNNYVTVLPFALLVFLVWAMTFGDRWALFGGVFVASFLAQTHVGFVVLALPLLAIGAVWFTVISLRAGKTDRDRSQLIATGASAVALGCFLWLPVFIDVVVHRPSNLARIARWFRRADAGIHSLGQGWRVVSAQFAAVPEWLTTNRAPLHYTGEPSFLYSAPAPWLLIAVGLAAYGFRRLGRLDGLRFVALFSAAFVLGVIGVERTVGLVFEYRLRWTWAIGMLGFIAIAWSLWLCASRWRPAVAGRVGMTIGLVGLVVCSAVNITTAARAGTPQKDDVKVLDAVLPGVLGALDGIPRSNGAVLVDDGQFQVSSWYSRSLVLQLERHGYDARMPADRGPIVSDHRTYDGGPLAARLVVAQDGEIELRDQDPNLRRVAEWTSVTDEQIRAFQADAAALDQELANGTISFVDHANAEAAIDLSNLDPAIAWALAVYVDVGTP